jgi:peptidoglycan/LPS O-acetylase OafA/YrhL
LAYNGTKIIKENNFDILRLILALLVVFAHWNALTENKSTNFIFYISGYSVQMFFIVSGFLIFWSFDKDNSEKNFFIKRFFRIYPLYLIIIILQTLFFIFYSKETNIFLYIKYFFVNIFYLNFLSPSVGQTLSELYFILQFH